MNSKLDSNNCNRGSDVHCDDLLWKLENVPLKIMAYLRNLRNKFFLLF